MAAPALDWSSAQVHDAELEVAVSGERPKGWRKSAERTARLLGLGEWDVSIRKGKIRVISVGPGQEERLRHLLEGIVEQANAAHRLTDDAEGGDVEDGSAQLVGLDAEMTRRFRSFARQ